MASNKSSKSEGPFVVFSTRTTALPKQSGDSVNYGTYFKTYAEVEKYLQEIKASTYEVLVFQGLERVTFEHTVTTSPISNE